MPLPFYVCTFIKKNDDSYSCEVSSQNSRVKTLICLLEIISKQSSLVENIKKLTNEAIILDNRLIAVRDQDNIKFFLKTTDVIRTSDDVLEFGYSAINNLLYIWTNYQRALYSIITVSIIDTACVLYGFYEELYRKNFLLEKQSVINRIKVICDSTRILDDKQGKHIEAMLVEYLCKYPFDIEMWMRLTKLEHSMPWQDPYRMYNYLKNALLFDEKNVQILLFLAYEEYLHRGEVSEDTMKRLDALENISFHFHSMIFYIKALGLEDHTTSLYEKYLLRSIEFYDKDVNNYEDLAEYYNKKGEYFLALNYYKRALGNIQHVYATNDEALREDITDITYFFDYYYRGISKTQYFKEEIDNKIIELGKKVSKLNN